MARSDEERAQAYLPSDEDVAFYDKYGYWVAPLIIPDAILTGAERGMTRFYAEDVDEHLALDGGPPTSRALGMSCERTTTRHYECGSSPSSLGARSLRAVRLVSRERPVFGCGTTNCSTSQRTRQEMRGM